jgi:hypothetical protein
VSCYCDPTCEIRIEAKRQDLKYFGALAAPVELLSCVWGAMFRIAARFNTRGGDALTAEGPNDHLLTASNMLTVGSLTVRHLLGVMHP